MGLGAVWVGAFNEERVAEILNIPSYARPMAIIPIGYPAEKPSPRRRMKIEEITHWERW